MKVPNTLKTQLTQLRRNSLRASQAEVDGQWHIVVQCSLVCLEGVHNHGDLRATRFFADKLARAYSHMDMSTKAHYYKQLATS
jgi:hypothetical protein